MQYGRPVSNVTTTGWSASSGLAYSCIDESTYDDGDYVYNVSAGTNTLEVLLSELVDPASSSSHTLRYRFELVFSGLIEDEPESTIRFSLVQGASVIATETRAYPYDLAATSYSLALSAGQANSITDYTDLRFRVEVLTGWPGAYYKVTWAELEIPDSASGSNVIVTSSGVQGVNYRAFDYPWSLANGQDREGRVQVSSTFPPTRTVKGGRPIDRDDAQNGRVCSFLGIWFPGHQIVYVDGRPYSVDVAPEPQR